MTLLAVETVAVVGVRLQRHGAVCIVVIVVDRILHLVIAVPFAHIRRRQAVARPGE